RPKLVCSPCCAPSRPPSAPCSVPAPTSFWRTSPCASNSRSLPGGGPGGDSAPSTAPSGSASQSSGPAGATRSPSCGPRPSCAAGIDFFTIPTVTFRVLYGFVVLGHGRRRILHLDVTEHPTAEWTRIQVRAALPEPPRFVHRDRGSAFEGLGDFLHRLGCEEE